MLYSIAAIDEKHGLATDVGIPWNLPRDKQFFVDQTSEGLILMGAGTYREFLKPLHDRTNYVLTHDTAPARPGFEAVHDLVVFLQDHRNERINDIGGAGLYAQTIAYSDVLILTRVLADFQCTKFFPPYTDNFELHSQSEIYAENDTAFRFETWYRKPGR